MHDSLITTHLRSSFRAIGAYVCARPVPPVWTGRAQPQRISVRDERFELMLTPRTHATVIDSSRAERHLVLRLAEGAARPEHFLCGFDEHHWFAAAVTGTNVSAARDSLMPDAVRAAVRRAGAQHARHRRHTKAFIRQGEWFFVAVELKDEIDPLLIHTDEPLIRPGGGKPHIVEELVRGSGEVVWHHPKYSPAGFTEDEFRCVPEWIRRQTGWDRHVRVRGDDSVLARGAVRHPDHDTIFLGQWHRVFLNREHRSRSLGFLD